MNILLVYCLIYLRELWRDGCELQLHQSSQVSTKTDQETRELFSDFIIALFITVTFKRCCSLKGFWFYNP